MSNSNQTIVTTPNGATLLVVEDFDCLYSSIKDYDEWTSNAIGVYKTHRKLKNLNTDLFDNNQAFINYLVEHLNTDVGAYCIPYATQTKRNWELEVSCIHATHDTSKFKQLDYNQVAYQIWTNRWKPVLQNYIKYFEEQISNVEDYADSIVEDFEDLTNHLIFTNFDLLAPLDDFFKDVINYLATDVEDKEKHLNTLKGYTQKWVDHLKENCEFSEETFKTQDLDKFIEFFHEMHYCSSNFSLCTPEGHNILDVDELIKDTLFDLYFKYNPYTFLACVSDSYHHYNIDLASDHTDIDEDIFADNNAIIIATDLDQAKSVVDSVNQFLNGSWFSCISITIVTDENKSDYKLADLEKTSDGVYYITGDSSWHCGFQSVEDAIENY